MSDDESKRPEDPDRAAILARRQHFIAIALSGLATTTACASTGENGTGTKEAEKKGQSEAPPEPCLKVAPRPCLKKAAPKPCLNVAPSE